MQRRWDTWTRLTGLADDGQVDADEAGDSPSSPIGRTAALQQLSEAERERVTAEAVPRQGANYAPAVLVFVGWLILAGATAQDGMGFHPLGIVLGLGLPAFLAWREMRAVHRRYIARLDFLLTRALPGFCLGCGYDAGRDAAAQCPECGRQLD